MYERNPGEIDFGSNQREVRVNKGSSYRESTVFATLKSSSQSIHDHFYSEPLLLLC